MSFAYTVSSGAYLLGFSLIPESERVFVNGEPLSRSEYEIDYEIGLLILLIDVEETDVILVEYERFSGGLGGTSDYARYFLGLNLDLPVSEALHVTATIQQGVDNPQSVSDPESVRTMPNRQTVAGVVGSITLDDLTGDFALGYGVDRFPFDDNERPPLPNEVTAIVEGAGYLFVGHRNGFSVLRDGIWRGYGVSEGLAGRDVRAVAVGGERVYFGTNAGLTVVSLTGVAPLDRVGSWSRYTELDGLPEASVRAVLVDKKTLWIATDTTVSSVLIDALDDPTAWTSFDVSDLPELSALARTSEGLYLGTEAGLFRLDPVSGQTTIVPGSGGMYVHDIARADGTLYVSSDRGLRSYRNGVGTGWIVLGEPIYAAIARADELYYATDGGLTRASDGSRFHEGWAITALATDKAGDLWVGSRADADYKLMIWRHNDTVSSLDNVTTEIDGRDPNDFGDLVAEEHIARGAFARGSFQHESDRFTLDGDVRTTAPGYHSIGSSGGVQATEWSLDAEATPWDPITLSASHEASLRNPSSDAPRTETENRVVLAADFRPRVQLAFDYEAINDDPAYAGSDTTVLGYRFAADDSLFDGAVDLSVSWSNTTHTDRPDDDVRRSNRLSATATVDPLPDLGLSITWERPTRSSYDEWGGSETWTLTGDGTARFGMWRLAGDAVADVSRSLPDGTFRFSATADADLDIDSFDVAGWRLTPSAQAGVEYEDSATSITGRAILRSNLEGLSIRTTLSGDATGLGDPVTRTSGKAVVAVSYNGSESWRPTLTYSVDRDVTIQEDVGRATSIDHRLSGRSTWSTEGASDALSFSLRARRSGEYLRVSASVDNSYRLDVTEPFLGWASTDAAPEEEPSPYPTATLRIDGTGDYLWEREEGDFDLNISAHLDLALSEMWGGSLTASYLTGTKSTGDLYNSLTFALTVAIDF